MIDDDLQSAVEATGIRVLSWNTDDSATVECPGAASGSAEHQRRPQATLFTSPFLYLHCFHDSCKNAREQFNQQLFELNDQFGEQEAAEPTPAQLAAREFRKRLKKLSTLARIRLLPALPERDEAWWLSRSPYPVARVPLELHYKLFLSALHRPLDIVWCGERHESGPGCEENFRTVHDWCSLPAAYGQLTSLVVFKPGVLDHGERRQKHVLLWPYHVLECDHLSKGKAGGVLEWAMKYVKLRAIVDTAGKSLHGLFEILVPHTYDPHEYQEGWRRIHEWEAIACGLDADRQMLRSSLTCRLAGAVRLDEQLQSTGRRQRLIWLDPRQTPAL